MLERLLVERFLNRADVACIGYAGENGRKQVLRVAQDDKRKKANDKPKVSYVQLRAGRMSWFVLPLRCGLGWSREVA